MKHPERGGTYRPGKKGAPRGRVRIIGGRWRGRWLPVRPHAGLRPSADRVRETLFNWLQAYVPGARCLDLFAGTGALGFEAASRGAEAATLIDTNSDLVQQLKSNKAILEAKNIDIVHADAIQWLKKQPAPFDIIFIDPPFHSGYVSEALRLLEQGWVKPDSLVYVESERGSNPDRLPEYWRVLRRGETRHVSYALIRRDIG